MRNLSFKKMLMLIAFAGLILFAVLNFNSLAGAFWVIVGISTPFLLGIAMAFILNMIMVPVNTFLTKWVFKKKKGTAKGISILVSYLVFITVVIALLAFVIPELTKSIITFVGNMSTYMKQLEILASSISQMEVFKNMDFNAVFTEFNDIIKNLANYILAYLGDMVPKIFLVMSNIVSVAFNMIMAVVISANILIYKEKLINQISRTTKVFLPKKYSKLAKLAVVTADSFHKYIAGQMIEALILGGLCYIGMIIFRFDYALLISCVIAVTALIPVAGAYIGGVVAVILLVMVSPVKAVLFLIYLVILQQIETNLIYPKVVGSSLELPGIWVIFAVTLGGGALGVAGILFAVPIMSIIYKLVRESVTNREVGVKDSPLDTIETEEK